MTLAEKVSDVVRKTPGKAAAIVRRVPGLTRPEQDSGMQYVTVALLLGRAYDTVKRTGQRDVEAWVDAQVFAGELVTTAATMSAKPPAYRGTLADHRYLAQEMLARAETELGRYGIDQRRTTLTADDVLSPDSIQSWATRYGIEETLPTRTLS